jgi:predicted O-methyltransferase YrrM
MFSRGQVQDADGHFHDLHSHLGSELVEALYRAVVQYKPKNVLEIGMAYGPSSLAILSALSQLGPGGRLTSVDPSQSTDWKGLGTLNVARAGLGDRHTLVEETDYRALPALLDQGLQFDFAYIDGWHTFDYVLLDFFYVDKLLSPSGVVAFNDCDYRAIDRVLKFVTTHRRYKEIDVGLGPNYTDRNVVRSFGRRVLRRSQSDRYFLKQESWEPSWDYYARF